MSLPTSVRLNGGCPDSAALHRLPAQPQHNRRASPCTSHARKADSTADNGRIPVRGECEPPVPPQGMTYDQAR
ncbi:hypothetical protein GCM10010271_53760 [Streptomyces kurssanovii]|nr:hypothetical protein GCM10010271_53760 [Streptomyces kurssanovii]